MTTTVLQVNKRYVIPMLGRISHISSDETKQALYPEEVKLPTKEQLKKYGLRDETPYYHPTAEIETDFDVVDLMNSRS